MGKQNILNKAVVLLMVFFLSLVHSLFLSSAGGKKSSATSASSFLFDAAERSSLSAATEAAVQDIACEILEAEDSQDGTVRWAMVDPCCRDLDVCPGSPMIF